MTTDELRRMVVEILSEVKRPELAAELVVTRVLAAARTALEADRGRALARARQQRHRHKQRDEGVTEGVTERDAVSPLDPPSVENFSLSGSPDPSQSNPREIGRVMSAAAPALLVFPCDGKVKQFAVTKALLDEHQGAFPSLDVMREYRHALAWVNAKPGNRKTAKGMATFLLSWCGRAQDAGRGRDTRRDTGVTQPSGLDAYCDWHREALNAGKPTRFPRPGCPDCKHLAAKSNGRSSDGPVALGDLFGGPK